MNRRPIRPLRSLLLVAALLSCAAPALARDLWTSEDMENSVALDSALKASWLLNVQHPDEASGDQKNTLTNLWRARLSLAGNFGELVTARVSYEHRTWLSDAGVGAGPAGILPSNARAPYRIRQLDWALINEPQVQHRHELDRAFVALRIPGAELTLGRQAIGLGRGMLFSAVDLFSPFSPLEVDREWRRGVDALRVEVPLGDTFSADVIGAAERDFEDGAVIGRVRGYLAEVDAELLGGYRLGDWLVALVGSAALGDAAVHAETAWFATDGEGVPDGGIGASDWVTKATLGGSYQFDVGRGWRWIAEYHYSGFGLREPAEGLPALLDQAFMARLLRGDTQTLGQHTLAATTSYDLADTVSSNLTALVSPVDGSGLASAGVVWAQSDSVTIVASAFAPWGKRSGPLGSEYGSAGYSGFVQLRVYD